MGDLSNETISGGTAAQNAVTPRPPTPPAPRPQRQQKRLEEEALTQINLHDTVPMTGEPFYEWFARRFQMVHDSAPNLSAHIIIDLATQPLTDKQIQASIQAISRIYGQIPPQLFEPISEAQRMARERARSQASEAYTSLTDVAPEETLPKAKTGQQAIEQFVSGTVEGPTAGELTLQEFGAVSNLAAAGAGELLNAPYDYLVNRPGALLLQYARAATGGEFVTPAQAWKRAASAGIGGVIAEDYAGLAPGSQPYKYTRSGVDFVARWFLDPLIVGGKIGKGLKLAEKIPLAAGEESSLVEGSFFTRKAYEKFAKPPEMLIHDDLAQKGIDAIWSQVEKGSSVDQLIDRFRLPVQVAKDFSEAGSRGEIQDLTLGYLRGRPSMARSVAQAELQAVDQELALASTVSDIQALNERRDFLTAVIEREPPRTILREIPQDTWGGRVRQAAKRGKGDDALGFLKPGKGISKITEILPHKSISIFDKDAGRVSLERLGQVLQIPRRDLDVFVDGYLKATTREETFQSVLQMIDAGKASLPESMRGEATQIYDDIANSRFFVGETGGVEEAGWFKVRPTPNGRGRFVDSLPHLDSELAEAIPLPNIDRIRYLTSLHGKIDQKIIEAASHLPGGAIVGIKAIRAYEGAARAVSFFTTMLWSPWVLLRAGWPAKIVAEEQIRMGTVDIPSAFHHPFEWMRNIKLERALQRAEQGAPEEALADFTRGLLEARGTKGVVRYGEKGYFDALQYELQQLRDSKAARYLAKHGEEETVRWLQTGKGQTVLRDMQPILDEKGATVEEWVSSIESRLGIKAPIPGLRTLIAEGSSDGIAINSPELLKYLETLSADDLPSAVKNIAESWRQVDVNAYQRFIRRAFDILGSKPTNFLSRRPMWAHIYKTEKKRLLGLVGEDLAEQEARNYATARVRELLFDSGEKTSFQKSAKNMAPFFNAWQEVFERWAFTIPTEVGGGGFTGWLQGEGVLIRRAQALYHFMKDTGNLYQDTDGTWVVTVPGMEWVARAVLGKDARAEIPVQRLNILGNFPFSGPVPLAVLSQTIKGSDKWEEFFSFALPFGPETTLGPAWMNRAWRAATGKSPPWEQLSADYQDTLFDGSIIDWMRHAEDTDGRLSKILALPAEKRKMALDEFVSDATSAARGIFAKRAVMGFLLPVQPTLYWPQEREMVEFRQKLKDASKTEYRNAVDQLLAERPGLAAYFTAKSYRTKGEQPREFSREAYWRDWRKAEIKRYDPQAWADVALGYLEYSQIQKNFRDERASIGPDAKDWLNNYFAYGEASDKKNLRIDNLKRDNKGWAEAFQRAFENARNRDGKPLPDYEEQVALEFSRDLKLVRHLMQGNEADIDWGEVGKLRRALTDKYGLAKFYSNKELEPGPEKDLATYWETVFNPYLEKLGSFFERAKGAPAGEQSAAYEAARRFQNEYQAPTVGGIVYPNPEQVLFAMQSPEGQQDQKRKWATRPVEWLTKFQRENLGLGHTDEAVAMWDAINAARMNTRAYIAAQGWIPQQKEARNLRERLASWEQGVAGHYGLQSEYALSQADPVTRLEFFGSYSGPVWNSVYAASKTVRRSLGDSSPFTKGGNPLRVALYGWMKQVRDAYPAFNKDLLGLQEISPFKGAGSAEKFYDWLFWGRRF